MNCLLIMPRMDDDKNLDFFHMGLGLIFAAMKNANQFSLVALNLNLHDSQKTDEILLDIIKEEKIDAVLCGGLIYYHPCIKKVFKTAKKYKPNIITITGGAVISGDPAPAMEVLEYADYGIIGEGEITTVELCLALKQKGDVHKVRGLIIKEAGGYSFTEPREPIKDWASIPLADYAAFGADEYYRQNAKNSLLPKIFIDTSRGCPFQCTFCHNSQGKVYRERPLDDIFNELEVRLSSFNSGTLRFSGDLLAESRPRIEEFCRRVKNYGMKGWDICVRVPQVDDELAEMLKDAGCGYATIGLESASNAILKSMRKNITIEQTEKALESLRRANIRFAGTLIFGDSEETMETAQETLAWYRRHPEYHIYLRPIILFPGSTMYKRALAMNKIEPVQFIKEMLPLVNISKLSDSEYAELLTQLTEHEFNRVNSLASHMHPQNFKGEYDYTKMKKQIYGQCPYCGQEISPALDLPVMNLICEGCRCSIILPFPDPAPAGTVRRNLEKILAEHGRLAIWGAGLLFKRLIKPEEIEGLEGVYLVDRDVRINYGGKDVTGPESIKAGGIDYIVTVPEKSSRSFHSICNDAAQMGVKTIRDLYQIQDADFEV
ncbi:B12-binding domain-containing radical SAM protein [Deltaproteobacteria bacterium OttesenSCG-928-K17]|nr:B12-binding domain-containing radical SAM protein [Deltaproteobacteria bacterium OttesenSCG-928-K17]